MVQLKDLRETGFFEHRPAEADIAVKKKGGKVKVEIRDFHSPTICARLDIANERAVIRAEIPDFRSQIDCVMIDLDYDGKVFDIDFSDLPAKKTDLVKGTYGFDAEKCGKTVGVKLIDMLGRRYYCHLDHETPLPPWNFAQLLLCIVRRSGSPAGFLLF